MIDDSAFCSKTPYTKKDARTVLNERTKGRRRNRHNRPKNLRTYHCEHCNAWHLTHKNARGPRS